MGLQSDPLQTDLIPVLPGAAGLLTEIQHVNIKCFEVQIVLKKSLLA